MYPGGYLQKLQAYLQKQQKRMFMIFSLIVVQLEALGVARVVAAMIGLSIILLLGVLDWDNCSSMAASSAYFLYILRTEFTRASCSYCLLSALLSFNFFFHHSKDFGLQQIQKVVGLQLFIASLVVLALNSSYSSSQPVPSSLAKIELPYFTTEITSPSSPFALSFAKHLQSIGAKMYGAFWCSHYLEQKQMFGSEAVKLLNYVECFPDGYKKGTKILKACTDAGIEGFPTWVINGQVLSGERELSDLAQASGFDVK
nr:thiol-disulfide oxidoreductase LTO1-like [Ziziphus jujuba var. spinosa]